MSALPADTRLAKYCRRAGAGVRNNMALKLGPTGLGSGIDKDRADYFFLAKISLIKPFFRACVRTWFIRLTLQLRAAQRGQR